MTNRRAALNFILIDLVENQSCCLYNYRDMKLLMDHQRRVRLRARDLEESSNEYAQSLKSRTADS